MIAKKTPNFISHVLAKKPWKLTDCECPPYSNGIDQWLDNRGGQGSKKILHDVFSTNDLRADMRHHLYKVGR